jgi:predicted GNAT family acetyltransferase
MTDVSVLDNPMWHSLIGGHRELAQINGRAARYPAGVSPMAGIDEPSAAAFADLRELAPTGDVVALLRGGPYQVAAKGWQVIGARTIDQMVCEALTRVPPIASVELGQSDVPEMLELAKLTEPGPFEPETIRMGRYRGLRSEEGKLMAMAGERSRPAGFTEVSAVCTAPEFRGRGLARALVSEVARMIEADGRVPFLHLKTENARAKGIYEKLGFRFRSLIHIKLLRAV